MGMNILCSLSVALLLAAIAWFLLFAKLIDGSAEFLCVFNSHCPFHSSCPMSTMTKTNKRSLVNSVAENLIIARRVAGLSQHDLAERANLSRATIAKIETGQSDPRLSTISILAQALGITAHALISTNDEIDRMIDILDNCHAIVDIAPNDEKTNDLTLKEKNLRALRRSAERAAAFSRAAGFHSMSSQVACAIYNSHAPGIGAAIGAHAFRNGASQS